MTPDCPCMTAKCLVFWSPCATKGFPVAMAVTELWTGSAISLGGSLLYIFIAANASPTVGFLVKKLRPRFSLPWFSTGILKSLRTCVKSYPNYQCCCWWKLGNNQVLSLWTAFYYSNSPSVHCRMLLLTLVVVTLVSVTADESVIPTKTEYERYLDQVLLVSKLLVVSFLTPDLSLSKSNYELKIYFSWLFLSNDRSLTCLTDHSLTDIP